MTMLGYATLGEVAISSLRDGDSAASSDPFAAVFDAPAADLIYFLTIEFDPTGSLVPVDKLVFLDSVTIEQPVQSRTITDQFVFFDAIGLVISDKRAEDRLLVGDSVEIDLQNFLLKAAQEVLLYTDRSERLLEKVVQDSLFLLDTALAEFNLDDTLVLSDSVLFSIARHIDLTDGIFLPADFIERTIQEISDGVFLSEAAEGFIDTELLVLKFLNDVVYVPSYPGKSDSDLLLLGDSVTTEVNP